MKALEMMQGCFSGYGCDTGSKKGGHLKCIFRMPRVQSFPWHILSFFSFYHQDFRCFKAVAIFTAELVCCVAKPLLQGRCNSAVSIGVSGGKRQCEAMASGASQCGLWSVCCNVLYSMPKVLRCTIVCSYVMIFPNSCCC